MAFFCVFFFIVFMSRSSFSTTRIIFDLGTTESRPLPHFWKSTGFCPLASREKIREYLWSNGEKLNLKMIASLPNKAVKYVRIHWLMDLLFAGSNSTGTVSFKYLDEFIDFLVDIRLKPILEIMVRSEDKIANIVDPFGYWSDITYTLATRYIGKYGVDEVASWRFETWNEPDLKVYNVYNFTLEVYLQYVNGCSDGLKRAFHARKSNNMPKLGGPAGLFRDKNHPLCWGLLENCKKAKCPVQYISFHRKGDSNVEGVLNGTLQLLDLLREKFPDSDGLSIANDEADIVKNWSVDEEWRADARYAAMVAQVIVRFYKEIIYERHRMVEILSNDNAFMNYHPYYFTQRTLLARFQMNNTSPKHDQFIKKPVYSVMGLLSYLGDTFLEQKQINADSQLINICTKMSTIAYSTYTVLITFANDTKVGNVEKNLEIVLKGLGFNGKYVIYLLDNQHTNPYNIWKNFGSPVFPTKSIRNAMRLNEGPLRLFPPKDANTSILNVSLNLTLPSVALLHLCSKPDEKPGQVSRLIIQNLTLNEVLITWSDENIENLCVRTYEVEFEESRCENDDERARKFRRVNAADVIFLSYHHTVTGDGGGCEKTKGRYRVRAVDYWERAGPYSEIVPYPPPPRRFIERT